MSNGSRNKGNGVAMASFTSGQSLPAARPLSLPRARGWGFVNMCACTCTCAGILVWGFPLKRNMHGNDVCMAPSRPCILLSPHTGLQGPWALRAAWDFLSECGVSSRTGSLQGTFSETTLLPFCLCIVHPLTRVHSHLHVPISLKLPGTLPAMLLALFPEGQRQGGDGRLPGLTCWLLPGCPEDTFGVDSLGSCHCEFTNKAIRI